MSVIWITPLSIMISLLRAKRLPWTSIYGSLCEVNKDLTDCGDL